MLAKGVPGRFVDKEPLFIAVMVLYRISAWINGIIMPNSLLIYHTEIQLGDIDDVLYHNYLK